MSDPAEIPPPSPPARLDASRLVAWAAIAAGTLAAATTVARSGLPVSGVADVVAGTSAGQLTVLALLAWVVGRDPRTGLTVLVAAVAVAAAWSLLVGRSPIDPTGLGIVAPTGTAPWIEVLAVVVAIGVGLAVGRFGPVHRAPRARDAIVVSAVGVALGGIGTGVAIVGSLAVAIAWVAVASSAPVGGGRTPTHRIGTDQLTGVAIGIAVCAPGAFAFVAERHVERVAERVVDGGMLRLTGPLLTTWTWAWLLAASFGLVVVTVASVGREVVASRRWPTAVTAAGALLALAAGTFLFRVATLVNVVTANREGGDQFYYHVTANLLARGRGFIDPVAWTNDGLALPSALHGPAFPAVLSVWSRAGGTAYVDHQLASVLLGVPQVIAGVVLAHLLAGRRAAAVAAVFLLLYPNIWVSDGSMFVEGMMAGCTTLVTWLVYRWRDRPGHRTMALIGGLIAVAALTRGEALLLVPLLMVPMVLGPTVTGRRDRLRHLGVGVGVFVAVLAPWMIYNLPRFDVFVPLSTNSNEVLFYANCDDVYSGSSIGFWSFACQERYRAEFGEPPGDEAERAQFWRSEAIDYVREHADQVPAVVAARVGRQWELFRPWQTVDFGFIEGRPRRPLQAGLAAYYGMMALAVVGSLALRRRGTPIWPLWAHAVAVTLTAVYAYGTLRFRAPFEPILCVMAAVGVVAIVDRLRAGPGQREVTA